MKSNEVIEKWIDDVVWNDEGERIMDIMTPSDLADAIGIDWFFEELMGYIPECMTRKQAWGVLTQLCDYKVLFEHLEGAKEELRDREYRRRVGEHKYHGVSERDFL
jgi:hypothetical protein